MFCEECGKQIPDNSKFCDGCGAPVKSTENPASFYSDYGRVQREPVYQPRETYEEYPEREGKKKGGAQTVLIVALSVVSLALVVVLVFLGIRTFGGKKDGSGENRTAVSETGETREDLLAEEEEETQEVPETVVSEAATSEMTLSASEPAESAVPETTVPASTEAASEYILPTSNSTYLTEADLAPLTKEQLRLARNEIYARHGRKFKDASLNDYFLSKSWYVPTIEPNRFNENVFNDYETANRKLIADYEKKMGY